MLKRESLEFNAPRIVVFMAAEQETCEQNSLEVEYSFRTQSLSDIGIRPSLTQ
jgi:hypothetical protein